jgi:mannose/cellobiose epimerase-like protein (N-acyl-D-glucosamine 2-epimerase family)
VAARARARGDVERRIAETAALVAQARDRAERAGNVPRRTLQQTRTVLDAADQSLQNARSALAADDYAKAGKELDGVSERVQKTLASLDPPSSGPASRGRR